MEDSSTLLEGLKERLSKGTYARLVEVVMALLGMGGRLSMRSIHRWAEGKSSYRTVGRLFRAGLNWNWARWYLVRLWGLCGEEEYLLAGDVSVISKSGTKTHGVGRFFSGLVGAPIQGIACLVFGLVSTTTQQCYPVQSLQLPAPVKSSPTPKVAKSGPKGGRPLGATTKDKHQIEWSPALLRLKRQVEQCWRRARGWVKIRFVVLDGQYGNNSTLQVVRQASQGEWHLLSKLRRDAELYFWYDGPQKARGRKRLKGERVRYDALPQQYLVAQALDGTLLTRTYHAQVYYYAFPQPLNVVIVHKYNTATQRSGHLTLFCSDLTLPATDLVRFYSLRFQLEFVFRDAKQHFGWEDWSLTRPHTLTTALHLSLFMVLLSRRLLATWQQTHPTASLLDLKAFFQARRLARETLTLLPFSPDSRFIATLIDRFASLSRIHSPPAA